jgi:uncharacterized protein (DUF849 family)
VNAAIQEIPENHFVALAGLGQDQLKINTIAVALGLGVRIGLEDNLWWDNEKSTHATNMSLLKRVHDLIDLHQAKYYPSVDFGNLGFYNSKVHLSVSKS